MPQYNEIFIDDPRGGEWLGYAQMAYHAYGESTDFKNFQGNPMPIWGALPERIRAAWGCAVRAVIVGKQEDVERAAAPKKVDVHRLCDYLVAGEEERK
jgi:hypothetical protein